VKCNFASKEDTECCYVKATENEDLMDIDAQAPADNGEEQD
jgi:hypothetical protein